MSKYFISVIMPIYNAEKYVKKSIDSLVNQTTNEIEIILVDDGSTDGSGSICDQYDGSENVKSFIKKMEEYVQHEMLACYKQKANMYLS